MVRRVAKVGLLLLCAAAVNFAAPARSEAQLIPSVWNSIFGPSWYYTGYYGPAYTTSYYAPSVYTASYLDTTAYYGGYGTTAFYGSVCCPTTCCSPCDPCSACSPCAGGACIGGACAGGACAAGYGSCSAGLDSQSYTNGQLKPTPDNGRPNIPRTYGSDTNDRTPVSPMGTQPSGTDGTSPYGDRDEGFRRREEPMDEPFGTSTSTESFRFDPPAETIPQREANPADAATPETDNQNTGNELRLPSIDLDNKVTWQAAPQRTRLSVRSTFKSPTIARAKVESNGKWAPVKDATKIVKK